MKKAIIVLAAITGMISMLLTGCAESEKLGNLEMSRLQNDAGAFQFYDLEWESSFGAAQDTLGITFGEPDTAGGFQIYKAEDAYTWNNVSASITCEYKADKLYVVTLQFMPQEEEREAFWSALKGELFEQYGTVEGNIQTSASEQLNITTESENYLWKNPSDGDTMMSAYKFSVNGEFKYISLSVYMVYVER